MAMFPNATRGYMPFVSGQKDGKKNEPVKKSKCDKRKAKGKTYQVTLRDKSGNTYSYILKTDGTSSMPTLCSQSVNGVKTTDSSSLPNMGIDTRKILSSMNLPQDCKEDGGAKKEGLFSSLVRFLKQKTGKSKSGKSKRKVKTLVMRKRQRTISAMSNLDPIQECPDEDEYSDYDDTDSYNHDSSDTGSEISESLSIGGESKQDETETKKES